MKAMCLLPPFSKATNPPLPQREGLGVRSTEKAVEMMKLMKRQVKESMFSAGVGN
jgi:hypothetical protein